MVRMEKKPIYEKIAYDIALKIATGEIGEGCKLSGRSLTGAQYGASSETIRKALKTLSDADVLTVRNNSGAYVSSRERAATFVERQKSGESLLALKMQLKVLMDERDQLNGKISTVMDRIFLMEEKFQSNDQLRPFEFNVKTGSLANGKTIGELAFRQKTGATIIAIRRSGDIIPSPGPEEVLKSDDVLFVAGNVEKIGTILNLVG